MRMGLVQIYRPCERPVPLAYKTGYTREEGTEIVNEMTVKPNTHNHHYEILASYFFFLHLFIFLSLSFLAFVSVESLIHL